MTSRAVWHGGAAPVRWLACAALLGIAACEPSEPMPEASLADILAAQGAADAALQQDDLETARVEYGRLIQMTPAEAAGYAGLGLTALKAGDLEEAERQLLEARERDAEAPELGLALARLRLEQGDEAAARGLLDENLSREPGHARSLWALADLDLGTGDGAAAAGRLSQLVAAAPGNLAARLRQADALLVDGRTDDALGALEAFVQIAPDLSAAQRAPFDAAEAALREGDAQTAVMRLAEFRADFEVTGAYQEGLAELAPPAGALVGIPGLNFSFLTSLRIQEPEAVLAALRYTEASELAGFSTFPTSASSAAVALGDFDGDGDEDLLWAQDGEARFLRVDFGSFVDAAGEFGPAPSGAATTALWADLDDDRRLDVWFAGEAPSLFMNDAEGGLRAVDIGASAAGGPANDAVAADLDQDGDLDVFEVHTGTNRLFRNDGDGSWSEMAGSFGLAGDAGDDTRAVAYADMDNDRDLDLALAQGAGGLRLLANARGGRFEDATAESGLEDTGPVSAIAWADVNADGDLDLVTAGSGGLQTFLGASDGRFAQGHAMSLGGLEPADVHIVDFDNDGRVDIAVAGMSASAAGLRLYRNDGDAGFADGSQFLPDVPGDVRSIGSFDYNEDGDADLMLLLGDGRPSLLRNDGGNANHYLKLELAGLGEGSRKNNRFGIGARVEVRAGDLYQVHTITDPTALIGLDGRLKADVIRVYWPNGVPQDLYFPGTDQDLIEQQTLKGSCPLLYVWDGEGFEFVGDIMWKSALGMPLGILGGGGSDYAPAFPSQEFRRLPAGVMQPLDGEYVMQVTEELWETIYIDGLSLVAVDHPEAIDVYVDEKFVPPAPTELSLWRVGERHRPVSVMDERGQVYADELAARDFVYLSDIGRGRYQGLARPHELILDLGPEAASGDVTLFLTGWIFPTDASINVAMSQSDEHVAAFPALDVIGPDGRWQEAIPDLGFPSGKDKTVVADLRGRFPTDDRRVRIRTNLMVYWDEAFFTTGAAHPDPSEHRLTWVEPSAADLHYRGFSRELRKGGRYGPHWFDYDSVTVEPKWHDLEGDYTRFGDVADLIREGDDAYVIANAGDEVTVRFDAASFPELEPGWARTFLIYSDGWVKDGDLNTASGDRAGPLPFRAMPSYPPSGEDAYDEVSARRDARATYQTRTVRPRH